VASKGCPGGLRRYIAGYREGILRVSGGYREVEKVLTGWVASWGALDGFDPHYTGPARESGPG
jgi:hypothetical protein